MRWFLLQDSIRELEEEVTEIAGAVRTPTSQIGFDPEAGTFNTISDDKAAAKKVLFENLIFVNKGTLITHYLPGLIPELRAPSTGFWSG